jgi:hypothetical protein
MAEEFGDLLNFQLACSFNSIRFDFNSPAPSINPIRFSSCVFFGGGGSLRNLAPRFESDLKKNDPKK